MKKVLVIFQDIIRYSFKPENTKYNASFKM